MKQVSKQASKRFCAQWAEPLVVSKQTLTVSPIGRPVISWLDAARCVRELHTYRPVTLRGGSKEARGRTHRDVEGGMLEEGRGTAANPSI